MSATFDQLVSQTVVAGLIGMSESWLEQCRFRGTGIPYVKCGRAVRYKLSEVIKWIDDHVVATGI